MIWIPIYTWNTSYISKNFSVKKAILKLVTAWSQDLVNFLKRSGLPEIKWLEHKYTKTKSQLNFSRDGKYNWQPSIGSNKVDSIHNQGKRSSCSPIFSGHKHFGAEVIILLIHTSRLICIPLSLSIIVYNQHRIAICEVKNPARYHCSWDILILEA